MSRFQATTPNGVAVQQLEGLVRTAIFKPANALIGELLQQAADRIDAAYQAKPGQRRKGREQITVQGIFGSFPLERDYYYHEGKKEGHYPADAALGLEGGNTPALARLVCLEGADKESYQKAEEHLRETGGIVMPSRQIQRTWAASSPSTKLMKRAARFGITNRPPMFQTSVRLRTSVPCCDKRPFGVAWGRLGR
jgi:hypothetical protein